MPGAGFCILTFSKSLDDFDYSFNPFVINVPFLYPLKTSMFSGGRERVHWERMSLEEKTRKQNKKKIDSEDNRDNKKKKGLS